jgi:membrane protease YdiL (CAAX protease family)
METRTRTSAVRSIAVAGLASFGVAALGTITWGPLILLNMKLAPAVPWSVPVEGLALALIWAWLSGRWRPVRWAPARRQLLRSRMVSPAAFAWAAAAGGLSLVALAGLWIVLVRMTGAGGNPTLPTTAVYPAVVVAALIVMASLVSPLTEEAAFRGYGQVLLERRFPPVAAVALSSLFFTLYHGPTQGFQPSKLAFYFTVGVVFGTIAYLTGSVLPAIPVHIAGDLLFFTAIWPHDAGRALIWTHGADPGFWLNVAQLLVFAGLALLAFRRLRAVTRAAAGAPRSTAAPTSGRRFRDTARRSRPAAARSDTGAATPTR